MPSLESTYVVAVDIGGTFTDISLMDRKSGQVWRTKTPSIPGDPSEAFMTGVHAVLSDAKIKASVLDQVLHGTTVATNMILEGKGAKTALITTQGFRHVLAIGRQDIPRKANLYSWVKPQRPVPASRIIEIGERIGAGGEVLTALDEASVFAATNLIREMEVEAIAVCLLHAYANPEHERRVVAILRAEFPDLAITCSTDILPVVREFERTLATVLNAGVMPGVTTYVARMEARLKAAGTTAPLSLMQSNGGVAGTAAIRAAPALTVLSGPAAGVVGAQAAAAECGITDLITVDIGGTSADICLIRDGKVGLTQNGTIGEWPLPLPMIDMVTIGAGGGSIAAVENGVLTVGPRSAGASPGPAAYGKGGVEATVTDAHLILGHLPERLLGGAMALNIDAAVKAVQTRVADPLGLTLHDAARGILAIVDNHMVGALRIVSVERGHDPRDFTLVPFGGAGPLHGCALADLLGISQVMIPHAPGLLCADGLLAANLKAEFSRTLPRAGVIDQQAGDRVLTSLVSQATAWLDVEGAAEDRRELRQMALLRFHGQGGEIAVQWGETPAVTEQRFKDAHHSLYGFTLEAIVELVTLRVEAAGITEKNPPVSLTQGTDPVPYRHNPVHFAGGTLNTPFVERTPLGSGVSISGPMVLTQLDATLVLPPDWQGLVHRTGAIILTRKEHVQ